MKWLDIINNMINNTGVERSSIVLLVDLLFRMNMISGTDKANLLTILDYNTYIISDIVDSIVSIYENDEHLDYIVCKLALNKYVRDGEITSAKRDAILSNMVKK